MKAKKRPGRGGHAAVKVYVESNLYCPPRHLEAEKLRMYFKRNGAQLVSSPETADINVLNTCAVLESEELKSLERVNTLKALPGKLIVVGCLKYISGKGFRSAFSGIALAPKELHKIDTYFPDFAHKFSDEAEPGAWPEACVPAAFTRQKEESERGSGSHWFVYASQGCEMRKHCSYCAIWKSTGGYRSKPLDECVAEVRRGAGRKTMHIMDSGAYGTDIGLTLPDLLKAALKASGGSGLFVHSLNPKWVVKYLKELCELVRGGRIKAIRFSHESGSDRILKLMCRPYTAKESIDCVLALRKACPSLKIMTQFIVGFPTETEADFGKTLDLMKKCGFDDMETFPFSPRVGTPAYKMAGRIDKETINRRVRLLQQANKGNMGLK